MEIDPTSFPELSKPSRASQNRRKTKIYKIYGFNPPRALFSSRCAAFSLLPGSEPIHLDLEKLFLLSDSMENLKFNGKIEISEPEKIGKNPKNSY